MKKPINWKPPSGWPKHIIVRVQKGGLYKWRVMSLTFHHSRPECPVYSWTDSFGFSDKQLQDMKQRVHRLNQGEPDPLAEYVSQW